MGLLTRFCLFEKVPSHAGGVLKENTSQIDDAKEELEW